MTKDDIPALMDYRCEASRLAVPCAPKQIAVHIAKLLVHYPQQAMTPEAQATRMGDWINDLADVPEDWIIAACQQWRRSNAKFAPTPGQLLDLIKDGGHRAKLAARAAEAIAMLEAIQ